ncbi:MAG: methylmalonyl-CoA mutase family protein [Spirochaetia bacterium]|nr:methylmalonyl-CoA mutase family protein [Spirochaetia bacterium]
MSAEKPNKPDIYEPKENIRFVTAASLFDGHDASINIFRRLLQSHGAEVIHLGHNRSVHEVVEAALSEDVQGIAISSYQGGHVEYFKYLKDLLQEKGAGHIKIYGGGGGVIVPDEIRELESYGITKIFSPEDGRSLGLAGIISSMLEATDFAPDKLGPPKLSPDVISQTAVLGRIASILENGGSVPLNLPEKRCPVLGITGPGGAGKSSLTDELILRFVQADPNIRIAVFAVDPTRKKTGGALLGDRIRVNSLAIHPDRIFFRSLATRKSGGTISDALDRLLQFFRKLSFDLIMVETSGSGQSDSEITALADVNLYAMTPEFGAPTQLEKIAMLDFADLVALNKGDRSGAKDALIHVRKQFQRNHNRFSESPETMPVYATVASRFQDPGVSKLHSALADILRSKGFDFKNCAKGENQQLDTTEIIAANRLRYLSEISETVRDYHREGQKQASLAADLQSLKRTRALLETNELSQKLDEKITEIQRNIKPDVLAWLERWPQVRQSYQGSELKYKIRDTEMTQELGYITLSGLRVPLVALPTTESQGDLVKYSYRENLPGSFPFTASVFPFRKPDEDPIRMFAGEGGPERTNTRFHYLTGGARKSFTRLSTAFDSVTLYGENPAIRPDIYGKIGNSGVSVPSLDDCKRLYSGFDLCDPGTSVSMTINGPAPMLLAFFFNTAIDSQVERTLREQGKLEEARKTIEKFYSDKGLPVPAYNRNLPAGHDGSGLLLGLSGDRLIDAETYARIKQNVIQKVRGTVQADILKEDQAQNTCIFSTQFALKMMGDIQEYFSANRVKNFYSVSISGYHIAEAGANPITQLAFTLANGFTYVEYYRKRGIPIDDFAPNLSFFFSNGLDAEYSVIGRAARRIWAVAMQRLYGGAERSQKLKYHIQTSGRSLHAMEIDFNDIRTTLQALYALYDNTNSLHTNAFDEAITTPTENSVRRAMAIQLIITKELGLNKNQNPLQGSYIIDELTNLVEEAVLAEFDRLTERGGVPGAMEAMYQRGKIQEESLHYEELKHSGELPIIGVNTFLGSQDGIAPRTELIRSTDSEKNEMIERVQQIRSAFASESEQALAKLRSKALAGQNIFEELMETTKVCTLGDISMALYGVGGSYRRNM